MHDALSRRIHLGNYEPLLLLAMGGMAAVYVARKIGAAGFERLVVVKRVHPHLLANRDFHDMFRDEARVAAILHHPNVVPVTDVVEADGELFLVMEYVDSSALSTLIKATNDLGQRLPPGAAVRILVDALSGLHAAHEAVDMRGNRLELVHRDVSPQNVIVGVDGSSRLIDFGVAKARHRLTETKSGSLKGKYAYMAPEQARAQPIDRRADLFSAGVVLWEALTGQRLFRGENELDTIQRIVEAPIPPPSSIAPAVTEALDGVVLKALARDRDQRFRTAAEFMEALELAYFPAPARDVASIVKAFCGERLESRRATLEAMIAGRVEPLSQSRFPPALYDGEEATNPSTPNSRRRVGLGEGTDGQIAATHDAPASRKPPSKRALFIGAGVAVTAIIVAAEITFSHEPRPAQGLAAAAPSAAAASAGAAAGGDVAADEIALELTAEAPIESVRALGMRSAQVRGTQARLVVVRWGGDLPIDAVLEGGRAARVVAQSGGATSLQLVAAAPAAPSAVAPAGGASPPPPPGEAKHPPHARPGAAAPPSTSELHANPYGP